MLNQFNKRHISKILSGFEEELAKQLNFAPLDNYLRTYMKENKSLGPKDRKVIADSVFDLMRFKTYLDVISPKPLTWDERLMTMKSQKFIDQKQNSSLKVNVRCSAPQVFFEVLAEAYGEAKAYDFCNLMNYKAPLTVRVNPLKVDREELFRKWKNKEKFQVEKTIDSPYGIRFSYTHNQNLFDLKEFRDGQFEVQDEGSQLASLRVKCKPGDKILDYCAGSGGKSLAIAHQLKGSGQIFIHDVRDRILNKAKLRFKRAGVHNVQFHKEKQNLIPLKRKFEWLILDVPCSGSGTIRRNPDQKYKFTREKLKYWVDLQRGIFDEAHRYIRRDIGQIVYITCSLLPQYFCDKYNMEVVDGKHFQILPEPHSMDCLFSATLQYKK